MAVQDLLSQDEIDALLHGVDESMLDSAQDADPHGVTSYDLKKLPEMLDYYASKGCEVKTLEEYRRRSNIQGEPK